MSEGTVAAGLGGGISSAVSAALLKSQGYEVVGVYLQIGQPPLPGWELFETHCSAHDHFKRVEHICDRIGIKLHVVDVREHFVSEVGDHFVHEVMKTRKPNACFKCSMGIKIPHLLRAADELSCDYIATGHQARITRDGSTGMVRLRRAVETDLDESHLLNGLRQRDLVRLLTPSGGLTRVLLDRLAGEVGLADLAPSHPGKICFLDHKNRGPMLERRTTQDTLATGMFRTVDGRIVGNHEGIHLFTVGQVVDSDRLNLKDREDYFVLEFDNKTGVVVVGKQEDLMKQEFLVTEVNWLQPLDRLRVLKCTAKLGMRKELVGCRVFHYVNETSRVLFDDPQHSVAPGEVVTFYAGEEVKGGGWIFETLDESKS